MGNDLKCLGEIKSPAVRGSISLGGTQDLQPQLQVYKKLAKKKHTREENAEWIVQVPLSTATSWKSSLLLLSSHDET